MYYAHRLISPHACSRLTPALPHPCSRLTPALVSRLLSHHACSVASRLLSLSVTNCYLCHLIVSHWAARGDCAYAAYTSKVNFILVPSQQVSLGTRLRSSTTSERQNGRTERPFSATVVQGNNRLMTDSRKGVYIQQDFHLSVHVLTFFLCTEVHKVKSIQSWEWHSTMSSRMDNRYKSPT